MKAKKEIVEKVETSKDLRKFQLTLLDLLDEFIRICNKHHFRWYLSAGSALGAVRHFGFIPWDDDIDVAMPRADYEEFLRVALDELDDKYFLDYYETNKYNHFGFAKIKMNNTSAITDYSAYRKDHDGFWLDIFPLDYNGNKDSMKVSIAAHLSRSILEVIRVRNHILKFRNIRHKIITIPFFIFTNHRIHRIVDWLYQSDSKHQNNFAMYSNIYHYKKDIYPVTTVEPGEEIMFEGRKCYVYHDTDKYLTQLYGDYMKLPDPDKRVTHSFKKLEYSSGMVLNSKEEYNKLHKHKRK